MHAVTRCPIGEQDWDEPDESYQPKEFTADSILQDQTADAVDPLTCDLAERQYIWSGVTREARLCCEFDEKGRPLNPRGRQGIAGRGTLPKWGENQTLTGVFTADIDDNWQVLLTRNSNEEWCLPRIWSSVQDIQALINSVVKTPSGEDGMPQCDVSVKLQTYDDQNVCNTDNAWVATRVVSMHVCDPGHQLMVGLTQSSCWHDARAEDVKRLPYQTQILKDLTRKRNRDRRTARRRAMLTSVASFTLTACIAYVLRRWVLVSDE